MSGDIRDDGAKAFEKAVDYEAGRSQPPPTFPPLPEIPGARYTDQAFYDLEFEAVWMRSWLCVGRDDDLRAPGSCRTFDKLSIPTVLVRGKDNVLRVFYNTCRHRGAPVMREESGRTSLLRCQYHSWSYGLDGRLIGVPDQRDFHA